MMPPWSRGAGASLVEEQGSIAIGCEVMGRRHDPVGTSSAAQPSLSLSLSLSLSPKISLFFEREQNGGGGVETGIELVMQGRCTVALCGGRGV